MKTWIIENLLSGQTLAEGTAETIADAEKAAKATGEWGGNFPNNLDSHGELCSLHIGDAPELPEGGAA